MNSIRLRGTIADRPSPINDGAAIRFYLRTSYPPAAPQLPPSIVDVPCRVFNPMPEQREMLLGGKHRKMHVEAAGRLEHIVSEDSDSSENGQNKRRHNGKLEMIVNQKDLFLEWES